MTRYGRVWRVISTKSQFFLPVNIRTPAWFWTRSSFYLMTSKKDTKTLIHCLLFILDFPSLGNSADSDLEMRFHASWRACTRQIQNGETRQIQIARVLASFGNTGAGDRLQSQFGSTGRLDERGHWLFLASKTWSKKVHLQFSFKPPLWTCHSYSSGSRSCTGMLNSWNNWKFQNFGMMGW